jgi:hypothetical protein
MPERTEYLLGIERYMPRESDLALTYFVQLNPKYDGAKWADCLDVLLETDAHLDVTEPTYEALKPIVPIGTEPWILPITMTLLYAHKGAPPYTVEVAYEHGRLTARVEQDTGGRF